MLICMRSASKPIVRPSSPSRLARSSAASRIAARVCSPFRIAVFYRSNVTERKSNGRTIIECCRPRNKDFIRNRFLTWFQFCDIRQSDESDFLEAFALRQLLLIGALVFSDWRSRPT
ncbi:hypothetical protein BN2475_70048 [Paraburkholderia ribeironis]|uniref:Uncharacterized protein n=1 Tax=Paraburkholderia ribeironis TaxID=1247936 RepID=A0A1N7RLP7_9BURK|nr:hypothetical protein BN2475_70048 [Paraburkholderia ribeironis]